MSASVPREDDTEIPWSPKGPIERNVINIRIYIYFFYNAVHVQFETRPEFIFITKAPGNLIPRGSSTRRARSKLKYCQKLVYLFLTIYLPEKGPAKNSPRIPPPKVQVAPGFFEPRRHWAATLSRSQFPRWSGSLLRCPWRLPPSSARLSAARHSEDLGVHLLRY